jgi:hyaluronoglucosaminidase
MTLRRCIKGLVFSAASLVAAAGAMGQTGRYEMLWGAFGPNEPQVQTSQAPLIQRGRAIVLYTGQAGLYPKVWEGQNVNGGVPVTADINVHLTKLRADIDQFIPANFDGYAVIDYEDWDALWVDTPEMYREMTRNVVRAQYASLTPAQVEEYSIRDHEAAARNFLLQTINAAKAQRPNAKWGYYGYPRLHHIEHLSSMQWLWDASTAFYPVAYTVYPMSEIRPTPWDHAEPSFFPNLMQTLVGTARQIAGNKPVAAFVWCRYHNINPTFQYQMLNETDLRRMMREPRLKGADSAIFWDYFATPQQATEYNTYFGSLLNRVLADVNSEFNPSSNSQTGGGSGGSVPEPDRDTTPPPPPPPGGSGSASAAPPASGNTGTYTNTALPGNAWPNPNTSASNGDGGEPAPNPDPNTQAQAGDPNAPAAANTDQNPKPGKGVKKPKAVKGVSTKTNSRFASGTAPNGKRMLQRDLDRIAAAQKLEERRRRAAERNGTALADAPSGD